MPGKRYTAVIFVALCVLMAGPAAAQAATFDLGVTQTPSATKVKPGGSMTIDSTVSNLGDQNYDEVYVELGSLGGHGKEANNPYLSFSSSQGSCQNNTTEAYGSTYHF